MARSAKKPKFKEFNGNKLAYGRGAQKAAELVSKLQNKKTILELGCGKAELTLGLAQIHSDNYYIGVDVKSDRLWRPAKNAIRDNVENVAFLHSDILELGEIFEKASISEIWITFPDPFPKKRQAKHRMLNKNFLNVYKDLLLEDGRLRLKTDNLDFFHWAIEVLADDKEFMFNQVSFDLHGSELSDEYKIMTHYEKKFIAEGKKINYLDGVFNR